MQVQYTGGNSLLLIREPNDPKYYGYAGEKRLLHALKVKLQAAGLDVIKKRMGADGWMVADHQYYVVTRDRSLAIHDGTYAVRLTAEEWNQKGKVSFTVSYHSEKDRQKLIDAVDKQADPSIN